VSSAPQDADDAVRRVGEPLAAGIAQLGTEGLLARRRQARGLLEDDGVTYGGRSGRWEVDPLPVVLPAAQWQHLEAGLAQRAHLLDLLLADLYGTRTVLRRGLLPPAVVFGHDGFLRAADQVRVPGPRQLLLTATDLGRDGDGDWRVLGDRTQAPSGAGYAMEDRRVVSRVMAGFYRDLRPARLRTFFHDLRAALEEAAPASSPAPRVVLLTPGPAAETAFDQAFLATMLGYPLVEGADLSVRDGRVWLRSLGRPEPVDVVLRRVDPGFADPLELRPDSRLGVPGLLEAARLGNVTVVNPFGAGVLENPGLVPYLPQLCRALLDSPPLLADVETFWCGDETGRRHVLARLGELVIRPIARGAGRVGRFGWELSAAEREDLRSRIEAEPWRWCGQVPLPLSTVPVVTGTGLQPRRMVLRTFAVAAGGGYRLMAGGLARVAPDDGLLVSSQAGALAKDVWVQSGEPVAPAPVRPPAPQVARAAGRLPALAPRTAEDLFWLGRYAERAEDAVRLLRVVADLAEDYALRPGTPGAAALQALLDVLAAATGLPPAGPRPPRLQTDLLALTVDAGLPGGLGFAVRRTVEAAHAVREQLSVDTWVVLGSLDRVLAELASAARAANEQDPPPLQPTLARVLEGLLALAGLGAESMVRDAGWAFLDLGRRLERGLQLLVVLRQAVTRQRPADVDALVVEAVLLAAESVITHRRRLAAGALPGGTAPAQLGGVLHLLLADRENPRALAYQVRRLAEDVAIAGAGQPSAVLEARVRDTAARLAEADLPGLAVAGDDGRRTGLAALIDGLTADLEGLAAAVEAEHFAHPVTPRPLPAGLGWGAS
jgi:uncharacterized circularly permuted ATP-grasp superfamily protein/uncharacterized alpha-E superfamily protein